MKKILILISIFLLTGCYNYQELNNLAIVKGASIDYQNNNYIVNYAISNANQNKNGEFSNKTALLEGKGVTISDAIAEMNLSSPKELYIGHMVVLIVSEEVAKNGINNVADFFFRNPMSKKTFQIIVSKNCEAKDALKILSPLSTFPAENIAKNITSENSSFVVNTTLLSFLKSIKDPGIEPIAPSITIVGNKKSGEKEDNLTSTSIDNYVKIEPLAIFKDDIFIKWADEDFSKGLTILYNQSAAIKITSECPNGNIVFSLNSLKIDKNFKIDNKINFKINIKANTEIEEMSCNYDLKNQNNLKEIEKILVNKIKNILNKTINEIKETKIDSIGLGFYIYQNDYQNFLRIKDNYINHLDVEFEIDPKLLSLENSNEGTVQINE